jgi:hypothetical protein
MKKFNLIAMFTFLLCLSNAQIKAQVVNIPDSNFKALLLNDVLINTNADAEIQVSEAQAFTGQIWAGGSGISDLTGIEAFTAITWLQCGSNSLTSLDVSANVALKLLWCYDNQLTALDLSNNISLTNVICSSNQLTALDVSHNDTLMFLSCNDNQIAALDVTTNTMLYQLTCSDNPVTNLDLSANTDLGELYCSNCQLYNLNVQNGTNTLINSLDATSNPNLSCIQVDDSTYSAANWVQMVDSTSFFSTSCAFISGINVPGEMQPFSAYPNPFSEHVTIDLGKVFNYAMVEVRNIMGQVVFAKNYKSIQLLELELNGASGVYVVHVQTKDGTSSLKVIKE